MQDRLLLVIGTPRSGSTLLSRMLGAHSQLYAPAEPHLLTPLAHLGYYATVERAPYDPVITRAAQRELVAHMAGGEARYLASLRAYTDEVYTALLEADDAPAGAWLVDKTPAYALVLDFVTRLYPDAHYLVLTRNPLAIWSSVVESFFDGDHEVAHAHNPILERYVPAIARLLREAPVPLCHVRYEEMVGAPEAQMKRVCEFAGLPFEPGMVDYGEAPGAPAKSAARGLGDPMTVARETRPTTASLAKWTQKLTGRPDKVEQLQAILARLQDDDLRLWGFSRAELEADLAAVDLAGGPAPRPKRTRHLLERRLIVALRRNIHRNAFGRGVRRLREACDILLR